MVSVLKLSKCRLCLKLGDFYSIFTYDNDTQLSDMAMACSRIKIFEGDGLPDKICGECVGKLSSSYIFKQQCERADAELRKSIPGLSQPDSSPGMRCNSDSGFSNRTDNSSSKNSKEKINIIGENNRGEKEQVTKSRKRKMVEPEPGGMNLLLTESFSLNLGNPMQYEGIPKKKKLQPRPSFVHSDEDSLDDMSGGMSDGDFDDDDVSFKCDMCQATFTNVKDLTLHKSIHKIPNKADQKKKLSIVDGSGTETDNTQDSYTSQGKSMSCQFCKKSFKLKIMLNRHLESCGKNYPPEPPNLPPQQQKPPPRLVYVSDLKCGECGLEFRKRFRLRRHMRKAHNTSPPPMTVVERPDVPIKIENYVPADSVGLCPGCAISFNSYDDAHIHVKNCSEAKSIDRIMCKICSCPAFSDLRAFLLHLKEKHVKLEFKTSVMSQIDNTELQCRMCGESFVEQDNLVKHLAAHMAQMDADEAESSIRDGMNTSATLECRLCSRTFRDKLYLEKHMETQHVNQVKRVSDCGRTELKCDHCEKSFFYKQSLITHRAVKHGITDNDSPQETAPKAPSTMVQIPTIFYDDSRNNTPILTIEGCPAKCMICGKNGTVREMKGHNNLHTSNNLKASNEYTCLGCGLTFTSLKVMRVHFREHREALETTPLPDVDPSNFCEVVVANVKLEPEDSGYEIADTAVQGHNDTQNTSVSVPKPAVPLSGFTCPTCGKTMESMSSLRHHIRWHSSTGHKLEKHLVCNICNETFKYNSHYREHIKNHGRDTNLDPKFRTCLICGRVSIHMRAHEAHMNWHKQARFSVGEIPCTICKKVMPNNRIFKYHMRVHQKKGDITRAIDKLDSTEGGEDNKCGYCGKVMANATSLKHHMSWHNSKSAIFMQRYECEICKKWFTNKRRHELHMRIHTQTDLPFKCEICFKGYKTESARDSHTKMHSVNIWKTSENMKVKLQKMRENSVTCPICDKVYPNQVKLLGHLKLVHPQSKMVKKQDPGAELPTKHVCTICGKEFPNLRRYNNHLDTHKRKPNHFVKCKICGKNSYSLKFHNIHIKSHLVQKHRQNPLKCPHCDETFILGYGLHYHLRDAHQINEDYIADRNEMDDTDVHLEEFQCHICKKILASRGNYERHVDYHNSLTCNYCFKPFRKIEFLEAHINFNCDRKKVLGNADTFEKKLKCEICYKAFSLQIKLNCHLKTKHSLEPKEVLCFSNKVAVCDFCFSEFQDVVAMEAHKNAHLRFQSFYGCIYCTRKFNTITAFKKHKNHHLQKYHIDNPLRCEQCDETFVPFYEYIAHLRDAHDAEPDWLIPPQTSPVEKCPICEKEFNHMHNHLKFHEKYRCRKCKGYFFSSSSFNAHECAIDSDDEISKMLTPAEQEALEECSFCFRPYGIRKSAHLANHAKAGFIACRMCPRRFKNHESFYQHGFTHHHRNYKNCPLKCRHCNERFVKYTHYVRHNRLVHNKKETLSYRPNLPHEKCEVCDRELPNLANHYRYHLMFRCLKCKVYILSQRLFAGHECDKLPEDPEMWRKSDVDLDKLIKEYSVRVYEEFLNAERPMEVQEEQQSTSIDIHQEELDYSILNVNSSNRSRDESVTSETMMNDTFGSNNDDNPSFKPIISDTVSLSVVDHGPFDDGLSINNRNNIDAACNIMSGNVTNDADNFKDLVNLEGDSLNDILDSVMRLSEDL